MEVAAGSSVVAGACPRRYGMRPRGRPEGPMDGQRGLWLAVSIPGTTPARVRTRMGLPGSGTREPHQVP